MAPSSKLLSISAGILSIPEAFFVFQFFYCCSYLFHKYLWSNVFLIPWYLFLHFLVIMHFSVFPSVKFLHILLPAVSNSKYTRHYSSYVTEGGAKMLIRRFRNNDAGALRKYLRARKFRVINSKAIIISPREICKILLTPRA